MIETVTNSWQFQAYSSEKIKAELVHSKKNEANDKAGFSSEVDHLSNDFGKSNHNQRVIYFLKRSQSCFSNKKVSRLLFCQ